MHESKILESEEYVEQAYLFETLSKRMSGNEPIQELLGHVKEEILATTKLPLALDFMLTELNQVGSITSAMQRIPHYFTAFQTYLVQEAEREDGRFDILTAFTIMQKEAELRSRNPDSITIFFFQFETLCRHRLRYDYGMSAMALDPIYDKVWSDWIKRSRKKIESVGVADLVYGHSQSYVDEQKRRGEDDLPECVLFGAKEGKIALANRKKEPLFLFSSLQRQLGYPQVPKRAAREESVELLPRLIRQLERLEVRMKLVEEEQREGAFDLTKFYEQGKKPEDNDKK